MWLINTQTLELEYFTSPPYGKYAILSHTWDEEEVLFSDMGDHARAKPKKGWHKIQETCRLAQEQSLSHAWVDTCCIDKSSSAELSEAINSMFNWYLFASVCYVYLADMETAAALATPLPDFQDRLGRCRWFTRGWTLQELVGPSDIDFFDQTWSPIGTKKSLEPDLSSITGVDVEVLRRGRLVFDVPVGKRMSYAAARVTSRGEDMAYCLLGIFQVHMPLMYGEGADAAFMRLQEQIVTRNSSELSIFAWGRSTLSAQRGAFAHSPADFKDCSHFKAPDRSRGGEIAVFGNTLELIDPMYTTTVLNPREAVWREEIHLDLNLVECSDRTGNVPMWVTVRMGRQIGQRTYHRDNSWDNFGDMKPRFHYYPTRPWMHPGGESKPAIILLKKYTQGDEGYLLNDATGSVMLIHNTENHVRTWIGGNLYLYVPLYLCPFRVLLGTSEPLSPTLGTFGVALDSFDSPVTIIFQYARVSRTAKEHEADSPGKRYVSLDYICPESQPAYHDAMQAIRSRDTDTRKEEVTLAFDYAFQHLVGQDGRRDGTLQEGDVLRAVLEIPGRGRGVVHRFVADGTYSIYPGRAWPYDRFVLSCERVVLEEGEEEHGVSGVSNGDKDTTASHNDAETAGSGEEASG